MKLDSATHEAGAFIVGVIFGVLLSGAIVWIETVSR